MKLRGDTTITIAENARLQFGKESYRFYSYFNKLGERVPYAIDGYDFSGEQGVYNLTIDGKGSLWIAISYYENAQHVDENAVIRVGSYTQKGGTVYIEGAKYNATDKTYTRVKGIHAHAITISGGSLETVGFTSTGNIDISDATVSPPAISSNELGISSLFSGNITISRATINKLRLETKGAIVIQNGSTLNNHGIGRYDSAPSSVTITNSVVKCSGSVIGNEVTINGGQVSSPYGIRALTGNITINGGQITSDTQVSFGGRGIEAANGSIILKSSEASDFIKFSKLSADALTIEENRTYTDGTNYYDNTKTANVLALTDTTLRPANISILTGGTEESPASLNNIRVDTLNGGWYIVEEDITFTHKLTLLGDTTIILSGDAALNLGSSGNIINGETDEAGNAVYSDNYSLCIEGTGSFNVYCGNYAVYVKDYVQNGGNVNLQGRYGVSANNVTINGGKITASGSTDDIFGTNSLNIKGGQVTATNKGISSNVSVVIGYTNADDFINISKIDNRGTAAIKDGCTFTDGTNNYDSSTASTTLFELQNVTLRPKNVHSITITAGAHITVETDGEREFENATVTLLVSPDNGYAVSSVKYNNIEITPEDGVYSFLMPTEDVTITAEATIITYTITYDLDGGALADGKSNPESYTVETAGFTLNAPTKQGYRFVGWIRTDILSDTPIENLYISREATGDREYTAVWEYELARYGEIDTYKPDGSKEKPYIISTVGGWNFLVLQAGNSGQWQKYTGLFFRLDADLTVNTNLTTGSTFEGIFDGNGHKLTFDISKCARETPNALALGCERAYFYYFKYIDFWYNI